MQVGSRNAYSYRSQQSSSLAPRVNIKMLTLRKQNLNHIIVFCVVFITKKSVEVKKLFSALCLTSA